MRGLRRAIVGICAGVSAVVLTAGCAAGQHAQTAEERPSLDGTYGGVGSIQLEGVAFLSPPGASYASGASVPLTVYIANNATSPDRLTSISSPAFTGWNIVASSSIGASAGSASTGTPSPSAIGGGLAVGYGQQDLGSNGAQSRQTVVLTGLRAKNAPLYPGTSVPVTFTFAQAGSTTLTVPVSITNSPNNASLPGGEPSQSMGA